MDLLHVFLAVWRSRIQGEGWDRESQHSAAIYDIFTETKDGLRIEELPNVRTGKDEVEGWAT